MIASYKAIELSSKERPLSGRNDIRPIGVKLTTQSKSAGNISKQRNPTKRGSFSSTAFISLLRILSLKA